MRERDRAEFALKLRKHAKGTHDARRNDCLFHAGSGL